MILHSIKSGVERPQRFNNPFDYEPHPLCQQAADEVLRYVESQPELLADAQRGKMFGVLIAERPAAAQSADSRSEDSVCFLAAYSGLLAGRNDWPFFVPPVFDAQQSDGHFKQTERRISAINEQLAECAAIPSQHPQSSALREERRRLSEELQLWLFRQYRILNARGEEKDLVDIWRDYHQSPKIQARFPLPPGGSGDCCAPKLLQYAYQHGLRPVCIAEFWYGESPRGEIRHHRHYYPACRGKCLPILTFMLQGLDVEPATHEALPMDIDTWRRRLRVVYGDADLLVVEKPSGLLSVPGRIPAPSVETLLTEQYGPVFLPHRLDMDTSGLLVVARNEEVYKHLQRQFFTRTVRKHYLALLDGPWPAGLPEKGTITLPLRPDPLDRPRQVVDPLHGKSATTDYERLSSSSFASRFHRNNVALVSLVPHTGRTHQLRLHCAHPDGLGLPILGDPLYGHKAHRLCLHAAELAFDHPVTGERLQFCSQPHFSPSDAS